MMLASALSGCVGPCRAVDRQAVGLRRAGRRAGRGRGDVVCSRGQFSVLLVVIAAWHGMLSLAVVVLLLLGMVVLRGVAVVVVALLPSMVVVVVVPVVSVGALALQQSGEARQPLRPRWSRSRCMC